MANLFQTTKYVLNEVFVRYVNYLNLAKVSNRNIEEDFRTLKYVTGQTLNYRLEERYEGGEGASAKTEAVVQIVRPLSITKQFHTMVGFTGFDLTFNRARDKPFLDMMLNPRAKTLANKVEKFIADTFQTQIYQAVGTPGVPIDFGTITMADAYMTELGIPEDGNRYVAIRPTTNALLSTSLATIFNNTVNTGALMDGFIGHLSGFDFFKSNFMRRHTAGVGGGTAVTPPTGFLDGGQIANGPITGGNTFVLNGVLSNQLVFRLGDILEIDDANLVYMINPLNYEPLEQRAQFVVTADAISTGTTVTVNVNPTIVTTGARRNISAPIPNGAQVWLSQSFNRTLAFHNQAIVFAAPPLTELRGGVEAATTFSNLYKMSITYSLGADIRNYEQLDRLDIACGVAINPEFAVIIRS